MDQDAFRKLLSAPKQNGSQHAPTRGSLLPPRAKDDQKKSTDGIQSAFKPRKVKKQTGSDYRDRAAERRTGTAGDFAEVESVLETFEKQHANEDKKIVEERRKYLGGDSEHTVLVKGLDFALLEQTRARLAATTSAEDDEELEDAFRGAISTSPPPLDQTSSKKRTREDIVQELKSKRTKGESNEAKPLVTDEKLGEAKREGKFKPIGFKPIGGSSSKRKEVNEVKKKKKRKVGESGVVPQTGEEKKREEASGSIIAKDSDKEPSVSTLVPQSKPQPEPVNEDFDIFADAGEYEGINLGDDNDDSNSDEDVRTSKRHDEKPSKSPQNEVETPQKDGQLSGSESRPKRKWIEDEEDGLPLPSRMDPKGKQKQNSSHPETSPRSGEPRLEHSPEPEREPEYEPSSEPLTRLAPLISSSVPSIRDILAADSALEVEEKRKSRKEKQKHRRGDGGTDGGGAGGEKKKVSSEAKLNREYQKLKSYTDKKGGGL